MSENRESCDCRRVADYDAIERPGDFYFKPVQGLPGETAIHVMLPGHTFICIGVACGGSTQGPPTCPGPVWGWDGNEDKPTLTPSIHTKEHWHGFLKAGRLESC